MIDTQITLTDVLAEFQSYPRNITRAVVRAANRAIKSARTHMVREIAADLGLKSGDVRDAMKMREATFFNPEARLATNLARIPLIKFGARGPEPSRGRGRGVTYKLGGSRNRVEHGFIATMGGHRGVFARVGKQRLPVSELHGPSLGRVFAKFRPGGIEKAQEAFAKNFDHELAYARTHAGTD
ncbi:MAG TPA: phage tail protein [Vicinamibacterales bacterium]|nr:phage tail protein [Vicinamibacterales bacterium]